MYLCMMISKNVSFQFVNVEFVIYNKLWTIGVCVKKIVMSHLTQILVSILTYTSYILQPNIKDNKNDVI